MKKLMFAIAAVSAGICMADVTSANVVGYEGVSVKASQKCYVGMTFQKLTNEGLKLGDFGVNADYAPMSDTLTLLDEFGGTAGTYIYMSQELADAYNDGTGFEFVKGWYDYDEMNDWQGDCTVPHKNGVNLYDGEAPMIQASSDDADLVFAGQVNNQIIPLPCRAGKKTYLCNASPVEIDFGTITVNEFFAPMSDTLTFLDQFGGTEATYIYMTKELADAYNDGTGFTFVAGWYDYDEMNAWQGDCTVPSYNSKKIPAGQGFMLQVSDDAAELQIPAAL